MDTKIDIRSLSHEELLSFTENLLIAFDKAMQRIAALEQEVERLKRDKNNNSGNSSKPPSTDQKGTKQSKSANEYNQRSKSGKAKGGQKGHVGNTLTKASVIEKITKGELAHRVVDIGNPSSKNYISKYVLDLRIVAEAIEVRFHADANGHVIIPEGLRSDVVYGPEMKSLAVLLYGEGIMSTDRICNVLNSLSGGTFNLSEGSGYAFCQQFADCSEDSLSEIEAILKDADTLYTDGTGISTNGKQTYIRNFSTDEAVLYKYMSKKNLENLSKIDLLKDYNGTLVHDHETALYNFGMAHGECNAHIARYLKKNTEETGNMWSREMSEHLCAILAEKKERLCNGVTYFSEEELEAISLHYDEIIARGWKC